MGGRWWEVGGLEGGLEGFCHVNLAWEGVLEEGWGPARATKAKRQRNKEARALAQQVDMRIKRPEL